MHCTGRPLQARRTTQPRKASHPMAQASQPQPPLLALPGELRNRIYRLAVVDTGPIRITASSWWLAAGKKCWSIAPGAPPLTQACKQLRRETSAIYFEETEFRFCEEAVTADAVKTFERMAGVSSAHKLTSLKVVHRLPFARLGFLSFTIRAEEAGGGGDPGKSAIALHTKKRRGVRQELAGWSATRTYCYCGMLGVVERYAVPAADVVGQRSKLLAFLEEYARSLEQCHFRRGHSDYCVVGGR